MEHIITILTILFGLFKLSTESVITIPSIVGMKGAKVTLECVYNAQDRWYIMQWKRQYPNGNDVTITTLVNSGKATPPMPVWEDVDMDFKNKARTSVYVDMHSIDFKLSIHEFSCNDTGTYVCEVAGTQTSNNKTELTIAAKPAAPVVIDDEVILEINDTYTLECSAMAGIPAAELKWYYKVPGSRQFELMKIDSEQQVIELNDCNNKAIQQIEVLINKETDGIIYRCKVESDLLSEEESRSFYDDVLLKLPKKIVPKPVYRMPTTSSPGINKSEYLAGSVTIVLTLMMLVTVVLLF